MANTSHTQQALSADPHFQARVRAALAKVAWEVIEESPSTPNHGQLEAYARNSVLPYLATVEGQISPWLVERPNLFAFETSYDFSAGSVVTASGDSDIETQLMTDWNILAGVS